MMSNSLFIHYSYETSFANEEKSKEQWIFMTVHEITLPGLQMPTKHQTPTPCSYQSCQIGEEKININAQENFFLLIHN